MMLHVRNFGNCCAIQLEWLIRHCWSLEISMILLRLAKSKVELRSFQIRLATSVIRWNVVDLWIWATRDLGLLVMVLYSLDMTESISDSIEQFVTLNGGLLLQKL